MKKVNIYLGFMVLVLIQLVPFHAQGTYIIKPLPAKTVRILTLNTALLTILFNKIEIGMGNNEARAKLIAQTIRAMAPQPDIVTFQEAFDTNIATKYLGDALKDIYPYQYFDTRAGKLKGVTVNSGLAILSKFEITQKELKEYSCWAGDGAVNRKGILATRIKVDDKRSLFVFNTHTQAGVATGKISELSYQDIKSTKKVSSIAEKIADAAWGSALSALAKQNPPKCGNADPNALKSGDPVRLMEMREAKEFIKGFVGAEAGITPILFVGDFNSNAYSNDEFTDPENPAIHMTEKEVIPSVFGKVDTYNGPANAASEWVKPKRIDYILYLDPRIPSVTVTSEIDDRFTMGGKYGGQEMTDHKGLVGTIEWSN